MLPAFRAATEAMDQHKEKEENNSQESADQREEEEEKDSEEYVDQRKRDEEENNSEERTGQRKEESSEEAMAASSLFAHPCSLLQYVVRVCSCCLGFRDSFSDPKPSAASDAPAPANSSQEGEEDKKTSYFYMQEVITHVSAARRRPQPPGNPKEGTGGNGGQHN